MYEKLMIISTLEIPVAAADRCRSATEGKLAERDRQSLAAAAEAAASVRWNSFVCGCRTARKSSEPAKESRRATHRKHLNRKSRRKRREDG